MSNPHQSLNSDPNVHRPQTTRRGTRAWPITGPRARYSLHCHLFWPDYMFCSLRCLHAVSQFQYNSAMLCIRSIPLVQEAGLKLISLREEGRSTLVSGRCRVAFGGGVWRLSAACSSCKLFACALPWPLVCSYVQGNSELMLYLFKAASQECMYTSYQVCCCICCAEHHRAAFPYAFSARS